MGAWELALPECPRWSESHTLPPAGTWGPSFHPEPSIDCAAEPDAGAMWRGRVVQAWEDRILLEYFVDAAHTPDVDVQWWLLDATEAPNCSSLEHMPVVRTGTITAGKPTHRVEVDPWADAEVDGAPPVRRQLLLATGSPGAPLERVWYTPNAIEVSRTCE